ncbi:MAG TPA: hypothetical protein DEQ34_00865 [Balneolaceae bacterium]|nr:hypothetical protein [Balneolaceae bacterium]|tara:strand:- start:55442 stop:56128 length:687 start_codon:yes stop_codon:yes gene_type:complete
MSTKFRNLKNDLNDLEREVGGVDENSSSGSVTSGKTANYILLFAFLATLLFYTGTRISNFSFGLGDRFENVVNSMNQASPELLDGMGEWLVEMGYPEMTHEELQAWRDKGVTATKTSEFRDIGYTDITLEEVSMLDQAGVSTTFARYMNELGYELSIQDLLDLENAGVKAYFTSRMLDLGYTREQLTKETLIRLRKSNVTEDLAAQLKEERGALPTIEELIRYRISNQ